VIALIGAQSFSSLLLPLARCCSRLTYPANTVFQLQQHYRRSAHLVSLHLGLCGRQLFAPFILQGSSTMGYPYVLISPLTVHASSTWVLFTIDLLYCFWTRLHSHRSSVLPRTVQVWPVLYSDYSGSPLTILQLYALHTSPSYCIACSVQGSSFINVIIDSSHSARQSQTQYIILYIWILPSGLSLHTLL
jgi:hypothetical protein